MSRNSLQPFFDEGWISDVLRPVRSGKEADVLLCRGSSLLGHQLVAAKVYRPLQQRGFADDAAYWDGAMRHFGRRVRVAATKRSTFGRDVRFTAWIDREHDVLSRLHLAGAIVPRALARASGGLLLEWIGNGEEAAPQLRRVQLHSDDAEAVLETLLSQVRIFLAHNVVHADLSDYNVLWDGRPVVLDFPQAVDPRFNRAARQLLRRDVGNLVKHFGRYGLYRDPDLVVNQLWESWLRGRL